MRPSDKCSFGELSTFLLPNLKGKVMQPGGKKVLGVSIKSLLL
jgi:hypothetical protein